MERRTGARLLVWPWWQRLLHWVLAAAVLLALVTHEGGRLHEAAGYAVLVCALARIALGLIGPDITRLRSFVKGPTITLAYARALRLGREARHLNHNPLGAWMVLMLLALSSAGAVVGALYTTDRFWGLEWVADLHAVLCWPLALLVPLHLAGIVHASRRHHENLLRSMIDGHKDDRPT